MNVDPQSANIAIHNDVPAQDVSHNSVGDGAAADLSPIERLAHERWTKLPKARGRQPKDPRAQSIRFICRDIADQERLLREYLQAPTAPAEHVTIEFMYPVSSAFMVYSTDLRATRHKQQDEKTQHLYGKLDRTAVSIIDALARTEDSKDQMRRQKSIAKVCVEACERVDGFRYSFHNNWLSREDEACRFSYFCNDSTLNKGRAANEGAGTEGKKMRKAVYDCQGTIAVKFSQTKQSLEVHYKHIPMHQTYAERAPPPRKDSKRYKLMEIFEPEKLPAALEKRPRPQAGSEAATPRKSRKRTITGSSVPGSSANPSSSPSDAGISLLSNFLDTGQQNAGTAERALSVDRPAPSGTNPIPQSNTASQVLVQLPPPPKRPSYKPRQSAPPALVQTIEKQAKALTWVNPNQVQHPRTMTVPTLQRSATGPQHESATAAGMETLNTSGISISDFEALKAKLEAAEQRIKKLEAEKQTTPHANQPPVWNPYHPPLPPQQPYTYSFSPPGYAFPPQPMIPPAVQSRPPHIAMTHVPPPPPLSHHQQPYPGSAPVAPANIRATNPDTITTTSSGQQGSGLKFKDGPAGQAHPQNLNHNQTLNASFQTFVAYNPKPQRPVLDAQRQDAMRLGQVPGPESGSGPSTRAEAN